MNQQQLRSGSKSIESKVGPSMWWLGLVLALAAAVAISIAVNVSAPPAVSAPAAKGASNAGVQVETNDQRAHADPSFHAAQPAFTAQTVPSAADQGVAAYLRAHDDPSFHAPRVPYYVPLDQSFHILPPSNPVAVDPAFRPQTVADSGDPSVMNYLRAHGFGVTSQTVPSAADQGVMNYLRAHGFGASNQIVVNPGDQGVMNYLRAHGVVIARPSAP